MQEAVLPQSLEQNILTLLCFSDCCAPLLRTKITAQLFSSPTYGLIAEKAIEFIDKYRTTPKEHTPDLVEAHFDDLPTIRQIIFQMKETLKEINEQFVIDQLDRFITIRQWQDTLDHAAEALYQGNLEQAQEIIDKRPQEVQKDIGINSKNLAQLLACLEPTPTKDLFSTGITALDTLHVMPAKKTLFLMIAASNRGKTWFMIQTAKEALLERKCVVYVTLEMSENKIMQRFLQSWFSLSKEESLVLKVPCFTKDTLGRLIQIDHNTLQRPSLFDTSKKALLVKKLASLQTRPPFIVKEFPTSALTVYQLRAYLRYLKDVEHIIPDMVIVDHADLMSIDSKNLRVDTGRLYKDLRGLAVEENFALVTATQGNRDSSDAKLVTERHVAEDYSKIGTSDCVITYSQTKEEHKLAVARIYVQKARDTMNASTVFISQAYGVGQFALDSVIMSNVATEEVTRVSGEGID